MRVRDPMNNLPVKPISKADLQLMHQRIVRGLMLDKTVHFVFPVNQYVEVSYSARLEERRGDSENLIADTDIRLLNPGGSEENDQEHNERMSAFQMQFTRLTWPLRDLNVYTRISLPSVDMLNGCESISFPGNLSFAHSEMHADEKVMYDWLEKVQTCQMQRRQQASDVFDADTATSPLPSISVPSQLLLQYRELEKLQCALCKDANLTCYPPANDKAILHAWRWKSLLLRSTLLSALNGICEGLTPNHNIE